jgi:transketolase
LRLEPLAAKWQAFGWSVAEINGHQPGEIGAALEYLPREPRKPTCVVAHTVKGKGVSFMENRLLWHYRAPDSEELGRALAEVDRASTETDPCSTEVDPDSTDAEAKR